MEEFAWDIVERFPAPYSKISSTNGPLSLLNIFQFVQKLLEKFHEIQKFSIQYKSAYDALLTDICKFFENGKKCFDPNTLERYENFQKNLFCHLQRSYICQLIEDHMLVLCWVETVLSSETFLFISERTRIY